MKRTVAFLSLAAVVLITGFLVVPVMSSPKPISKEPDPQWELKVSEASQNASDAYSAWRRGGSAARAEKALRGSYKAFGSDETAYWLALVLADEGKTMEAADLLKTVTHPTSLRGSTLATAPTVLVQYAEMSEQAGRLQEAKWALAKAGARDWYSGYLLAAKHVQWDDHRMQADFFRKALENRPNDPEAKKGLENALKALEPTDTP